MPFMGFDAAGINLWSLAITIPVDRISLRLTSIIV